MRSLRSALREEFPPGVVLIYVLSVVMSTTEGTLLLLLPPYMDAYGYSLPLIGAFISALYVTRLVSRLPVGVLYGAASAKRYLVIGLVVLSIATSGFALVDGRLILVAGLTLAHGLAFGSLGTLVLAAVIDMTAGRRAGTVMAWYTAALSMGYAVGAFGGGALGDLYGADTALAFAGILPLVGVAVVLRLPEFQGPPPTEGAPRGMHGLLHGLASIDARVWLAFVVVLYVNLISDAVDAFFPLFGLAIGLTLSEVGLLKGLKAAAATAIRFASIGLVRFGDAAAINLWGVIIMGVATVALPFMNGPLAFAGVFIVLGLCRGLLRLTTAAAVAEIRREGKDVGLSSGVYQAGLDVGAIIGPSVGGVVANAVGIPLMFQLMALVSVALYFAVALSTARGRESLRRGASLPRDLRQARSAEQVQATIGSRGDETHQTRWKPPS